MKTTYQINTIGYIGILLTLLCLVFTSCKKDKSVTPSSPTTTTSTHIGKYAIYDGDGLTRDTIYVYETSGDYWMSCPDLNAASSQDTISISITGDSLVIPTQAIYGSVGLIYGHGHFVSNQMVISYHAFTYDKTNKVYLKQ